MAYEQSAGNPTGQGGTGGPGSREGSAAASSVAASLAKTRADANRAANAAAANVRASDKAYERAYVMRQWAPAIAAAQRRSAAANAAAAKQQAAAKVKADAAAKVEAKAQADAKVKADVAAKAETERARAASEAQAKAVEDKAKADMAETNRARVASEAIATAKAAEDKAKADANKAAMAETERARKATEATAKAAEDKAKADADAAAMAETNRARAASEATAKAAEDKATYEMAETNRARIASEEAAKVAEDTGGDIDSTYTTPGTGAYPGGDDNTAIAERAREDATEDDIDSTYTTPGVGAYPGGGDSTNPDTDGRGGDDGANADPNDREGGAPDTIADDGSAERNRLQGLYDALMGDEGIRAHWETIQQWREDAGKSYGRARGDQTVRMAAGGMKARSEQWETNLAAIDAKHATEMAGFDDSATMGIINRWIDKVRAAEPRAGNTEFSRSGQTREEYNARTTDEFMVANFGRLGGSSAASGPQSRTAVATDRRQGARSQVQQASPWWA